MKLDLSRIINVPGGIEIFNYVFDLSDFEWNGRHIVAQPLLVKGSVQNRAGVLELSMTVSAVMSCVCDRCAAEFEKPVELKLDATVSEQSDGDSPDIIPLEGDLVDLDEAARTAFILSMDSKTLCKPDCKGLCPTCGADLNKGPCSCKPEIDPRLAKLADFFD
ncbi:MAG: YceD family protein [Oscillospiraceae bacterium]|jgi:uncharacterized protein